MKIIYVNPSDLEEIKTAAKEAAGYLRQGKIIVYPTDTIYGIGCDSVNEKAVEKIFKIKSREGNKPLSVIVRDIDSIGKFAFMDKRNRAIAEKLLPGPYTLIFPGPKNISRSVTGGKNSIGIRLPKNEVCQQLCNFFPNPIITTSVNLSGEEPLNDPFKIAEYFVEKEFAPDLILSCGKIENGQPSMVIDLTRKNPQILRSGSRSLAEVMTVLDKLKNL